MVAGLVGPAAGGPDDLGAYGALGDVGGRPDVVQTPALVGGSDGQLISNLIAFHMTKSLNWSLAAALAALLLGGILILYWLYDRLIGIDNMKLG